MATQPDPHHEAALELGLAWQAAEAALPADRARYTIGFGGLSARRYYAAAYDKFTQQRVTAESDTAVGALRELATKLGAGWQTAAKGGQLRTSRGQASHPLRE